MEFAVGTPKRRRQKGPETPTDLVSFDASVAAAVGAKHKLGHIDRVTVENFKSYDGNHVLGPFDKFCCIIGPNGSGKSNVMDAISFCLGIRAKHLRGERMRDLIYRREEESAESNTRSARVTLHFMSANGELLDFERVVSSRGDSTYRYGPSGHSNPVPYEAYLRHLANEHIYVKARNFLVFQGDVMDLARRQGSDLSSVLETISGSDQLKDEYEQLQQDLEVNQEKARMHFQHQFEIRKTVQQLEKQREVVDRYQAVSTEKGGLLREMNVFKLFSCHLEADKCRGERDVSVKELSELEAVEKTIGKELGEIDRRQKAINQNLAKALSAAYIFSSNVQQKRPVLSSCVKTIEHFERKRKEAQQRMEMQAVQNSSKEVKLKDIVAKREEVKLQIRKLKKATLPAVEMTDSQRRKYEDSCIKSDATGVRAREQLREIDEKLRQIRQERQADGHEIRDLEERIEQAEQKLQGFAAQSTEVDKQLQSIKDQRDDTSKSLKGLQGEYQQCQGFWDTLKEEERRCAFELDLHRTKKERLEKAEAKIRLADELRAAFPQSVIGRVSELILPSQKRFELALHIALAGKGDAFVVSDHKAGASCIHYLKQKGIPPQVFLPLDRLKGKRVVGSLHSLTQGNSARHIASECVLPNEKFFERCTQWRDSGTAIVDQVVENILSGVVIVDDLKEARRVSYTDALKRKMSVKSVSLHGEVIQPNGNMEARTGESLGVVEFGGAAELEKLRNMEKKLHQIQTDLRVVEDQMTAKRNAESNVSMQTASNDRAVKGLEDDRRRLRETTSMEKRSLEAKQARTKELQTRTKKNETAERKIVKDREAVETELLHNGKQYFVELSEELGVPDIRELMLQEEAARRRQQQELDELEDRLREYQAREQNLEEGLKDDQVLTGLRLDLEGFSQKIKEEQERENEIKASIAILEENQFKEEAKTTEYKEELNDIGLKATNLKVRLDELRENISSAKAKIQARGQTMHTMFTTSCRILQECIEKQIEIPFRSKDPHQFEFLTSREHDVDEKTLSELEKAFSAVEVDFTCLPASKVEKWQAEGQSEDIKEIQLGIERDYMEHLEELQKELETLNPNMGAPEQHQMEADKLEEIRKQGEEANSKVNTLAAKFEACKKERYERFMKCYRHVESVVQPFYKELTTYEGYEGGSAYLDMDDVEEPYNGGITFTACPPGKRFFPMDLLSGGEKSMASMALLFAMHSYQPPPFMVLDEVDAPFDRKNTDSLVRYLNKLKFQCLVISLKDTFFKNSDSLVGVYKDKLAQTSGVVTLPLRKLGDESRELAVTQAQPAFDAD